MEYHGRARTFEQRKSADVGVAVSLCPVNCMHYVTFEDLKELEKVRDEGDGRKDHRHFGYTKDQTYVEVTPLHIARRNTDASHKDSWYHYHLTKCHSEYILSVFRFCFQAEFFLTNALFVFSGHLESNKCPQRGCFDCPRFRDDPQGNPYFQERLKRANHVRALHFVNHGMADNIRKAADL